MASLIRYSAPVDAGIPVPALLYDDERLIAEQDAVGLYDGPQKSPAHQSGVVHVTSHRLFFISDDRASLALDLLHIAQTEHYAGFLTSSAKVTLHLHPLPRPQPGNPSAPPLASGDTEPAAPEDHWASWECTICAYRNPPGLSPAARSICALCGVPRDAVPPASPVPIPAPRPSALARSLPASVAHTPSPPEPAQPSTPSTSACPACTFINHPSLRECEICGTALPTRTFLQATSASKSAPTSRPVSPDPDEDNASTRYIRLSFRRGGDKPFYAALKRALLAKAWVVKPSRRWNTDDGTGTENAVGRSGINGIMQTVEAEAQHTSTDVTNAFRDLEALMRKAQDMVGLAAELNARLSAVAASTTVEPGTDPGSTQSETATFVRTSLAQLGLQMHDAPITADMVRDERLWAVQLARELAGVLQGAPAASGGGGMMGQRGIVGLDEVWGGWNRARGVALVPPATLLQTLPHLPALTAPPLHARTLTSGLTVLHTPHFAPDAFAARAVARLSVPDTGGGKGAAAHTTVALARAEALSVALAEEMVREAETAGALCRDEVAGARAGAGVEVLWYANVFREYVWDGQVD